MVLQDPAEGGWAILQLYHLVLRLLPKGRGRWRVFQAVNCLAVKCQVSTLLIG